MTDRCCDKPIAKIVKIGDIEVGIIGLEETFRHVYESGIEDEEYLKKELLSKIREFGNYVTPSREEIYKEALLLEYRKFQQAVQETINRRQPPKSEQEKKWNLFQKKRKDS